jgi:hypothetical protein
MPMSPRTLRPRNALHPEAANWAARVVANGGSVRGATLSAVSKFCASIDGAGIRDRFFRLNLFCGTSDASLVAPRVPLYLGQSRTGTQYGDAIDANNNFVQGDYAENNGLIGNGSTKYLNTGFDANAAGLTKSSVHLASVWPTYSHPTGNNWFPLSIVNNAVNERFWLNINANSTPTTEITSTMGQANPNLQYQIAATNGATISGGLWTASRTSASAFSLYEGATSRASSSTIIGSEALPTTAMTVFVRWSGSAFFGYAGIRLRGYSVGLGMTAQQVADYNAAMTTFQAALGRA